MTSPLDGLPVLGVGASLSLELQPRPEVLVRTPGGPSFIEYAGQVSLEAVQPQVEAIRSAGAPVLFHPSFINFCGSFPNDRRWLDEAARHVAAVDSPWFAQDVAYCFWGSEPGYSSQFGYFLPPLFNRASLEQAVERVREVKERVGRPVAIEPPPMTFAVGRMGLLEFFAELATRADCAVLFDAGHLASWERATGGRIAAGLADFPCERVVEVHVAGGKLEGDAEAPLYVDAHERAVLPETWAMFEALLPRLTALRAVCFECEGVAADGVIERLTRIRTSVAELSGHAALRARATEGR